MVKERIRIRIRIKNNNENKKMFYKINNIILGEIYNRSTLNPCNISSKVMFSYLLNRINLAISIMSE